MVVFKRNIKFLNKTDIDSRCLRSIILAVCRRELKPGECKTLNVTITRPRRIFVTGKSYIQPRGTFLKAASFTLCIPVGHTNVVEVAHRVKVCLDYVRGKHGGSAGQAFSDYFPRPGKAADYGYVGKMALSVAKPKIAKKLTGASHSLKKAEDVQERVDHWEKKSSYAKNMLKKYQAKLKYHTTRVDKLTRQQAEKPQGMTPEEFYKLSPVGTEATT